MRRKIPTLLSRLARKNGLKSGIRSQGRVILLQHDTFIPTDYLLDSLARNNLVGIKLAPRSATELPSRKLIDSVIGVILVDSPTPDLKLKLFAAEVELIRNLNRSKKAILSLGSSSILTGPTHGAIVRHDRFHRGWLPVTTTKPIIKNSYIPDKVFVYGRNFVNPPKHAHILFRTNKKEISAYVSGNLTSLNFVSSLNSKAYRWFLEEAERAPLTVSATKQTFEELQYIGDNFLEIYMKTMNGFIEYWIKSIRFQ